MRVFAVCFFFECSCKRKRLGTPACESLRFIEVAGDASSAGDSAPVLRGLPQNPTRAARMGAAAPPAHRTTRATWSANGRRQETRLQAQEWEQPLCALASDGACAATRRPQAPSLALPMRSPLPWSSQIRATFAVRRKTGAVSVRARTDAGRWRRPHTALTNGRSSPASARSSHQLPTSVPLPNRLRPLA